MSNNGNSHVRTYSSEPIHGHMTLAWSHELFDPLRQHFNPIHLHLYFSSSSSSFSSCSSFSFSSCSSSCLTFRSYPFASIFQKILFLRFHCTVLLESLDTSHTPHTPHASSLSCKVVNPSKRTGVSPFLLSHAV